MFINRMFIFATFFLASVFASVVEAAPSRFRVIFNTDPAREAIIAWDCSGRYPSDSQIFYGDEDLSKKEPSALYVYRKDIDKMIDHRGMKNCFVTLKDLQPNTRYYFIAQTDGVSSKQYFFDTVHDDPSLPLSFVAGGDSRNNRYARRRANITVRKLKPHAVLFGGDFTGSDSNSPWQEWFDDWQHTISDDGHIIPIVVTRGNHEKSNERLEKLFLSPEKNYFAISFGGNLFRAYMLNTETTISRDQTDWLGEDLSKSRDHNWRMAIYHKPIRPHTKGKSEGTLQYRYWAPLFYEYGMQLALESDSHMAKRTYAIKPSSSSRADEGFELADDGTVFIGEGCWGAPLRSADDDKSWTRASGRFNQVQWLWVSRENIEVRTVKTDKIEEAASLTIEQRFQVPDKLDVWEPSTGSVVRIMAGNYASKLKKTDKKFAKSTERK